MHLNQNYLSKLVIKTGKKIEWVEVARRGENHNLLFMDLVMHTYLENLCGKTFGEEVVFVPEHYRQFNGARWFSAADLDKYVSLMKTACETGRIRHMGEDYEKRIDKTREFAEKIRGKNVDNASQDELEKIFQEFCRVAIEHWGHAYHYLILNRFLPDEVTAEVAKKISDVKKQNEYLLTLFASDKPTEMREENIALLKNAEKLGKDQTRPDSKEAVEMLENHLKKYAHLGRYYFRSAPYTREQITDRIKQLSPGEIEKRKNDFAEQEKIPDRTRREIIELGLDHKTVENIYAIKQYAFCSNHADETYNYFVHCSAPLLKKICRMLDCSWNELVSMQSTEIEQALEKGEPLSDDFKAELRERFKDHALILEKGRILVLSGRQLQDYHAQESKEEKKFHDLRELKGLGASPGKASGKVALVLTTKDLKKVGKGDVLVTGMTTPEFVPAMERACAIVTDDGGVLCHAAIVSRELHLPCVVGTRVATKALQDGQKVEVDATIGLVRKID